MSTYYNDNVQMLGNVPVPGIFTIDFANGSFIKNLESYSNNYFCGLDIINVEFYPPATKMYFRDGTVTTSVARDGDEFNKEIGMMHCIMKHIFKGNTYNNLLRRWIKHADDIQTDKVEFARKLEEEKQIAERQKAKKARQKARKAERDKQRQIEIQKEAYIQAMKEMEEDYKNMMLNKGDVDAGTAE